MQLLKLPIALGQRLRISSRGCPPRDGGMGVTLLWVWREAWRMLLEQQLLKREQWQEEVAGSITGFFDIHSPSRLMHGCGANVTDGFGLGIQSRAAAVVSDAKSLAKSLFNALKIPTVTNNVDAQVQQLTGAKGNTEKVDKSSAGKNEATKGNNPAAQVADMNKIGAAYKKAADARGALTNAQVASVRARQGNTVNQSVN